MPPYPTNTALRPPLMLQPGVPGYAFGSWNANTPTTLMQVTHVSLTSDVATVTVLVREGNIPAIGSLISISGTTTAGGVFNVSNVAITGVSIAAATGIGTITFALTNADVPGADDAGQAYVPVPEVGEALSNVASQQFGVQEDIGMNQNGRTVTWSTSFPTAPSSITATLQASLFDIDGQYHSVDSSTSTSGEQKSITLQNFRFLRVLLSNVTGTNPRGIIKILL